ncbi:MAG: hypothetical protein M1817_001482 [Caeruleum heppii]|nr:MAG: hypothetical protein M1817_001482 [Caeruleum heppii]
MFCHHSLRDAVLVLVLLCVTGGITARMDPLPYDRVARRRNIGGEHRHQHRHHQQQRRQLLSPLNITSNGTVNATAPAFLNLTGGINTTSTVIRVLTRITPFPDAAPVTITRQRQVVTSFVPQETVCAMPGEERLLEQAEDVDVDEASPPSTDLRQGGAQDELEPRPSFATSTRFLNLTSSANITNTVNLTSSSNSSALLASLQAIANVTALFGKRQLPPSSISSCTTLFSAVTTSICATTVVGPDGARYPITDCDQSITFATRTVSRVSTPGAAATAPSRTTFFVAAWEEVAQGRARMDGGNVVRIVCVSDDGGEDECQTAARAAAGGPVEGITPTGDQASFTRPVGGPIPSNANGGSGVFKENSTTTITIASTLNITSTFEVTRTRNSSSASTSTPSVTLPLNLTSSTAPGTASSANVTSPGASTTASRTGSVASSGTITPSSASASLPTGDPFDGLTSIPGPPDFTADQLFEPFTFVPSSQPATTAAALARQGGNITSVT